ncbi:MAG: hypothetical protein O3C40_12725 [Planctomycetota bacterium]|nr:hypothetical protein [Planctomycetota bacterium]
MIEPHANHPEHPDTLPETGCEAAPARAGGGKTMTVFGALFGAAAAVPT